MYEVFAFSMYGVLYSLAFAVALTVFYFCFGLSLSLIKNIIRMDRTYYDGNPELFKDFYVATPEMRIEMSYIMEDFAIEANRKWNSFTETPPKTPYRYSCGRLLPYGKNPPVKQQEAV